MLKALRIAFPQDWRHLNYSNCRKSLLVSGLCSSLAYRLFSTLNPSSPEILYLPKLTQTSVCHLDCRSKLPKIAVFLSEDGNQLKPSSDQDSERLEKLSSLQRWVEEELPSTFSRGIFESATEIFGQDTALEIERLNGPSIILRGQSRANFFLAVVRSYFLATSANRRIDILAVHTDQKEWRLETNFRIVLLPSPTATEASLPANQLVQRLEQRAKYHDFRAIFYVSKSGSLSLVKITKLTPPQHPPLKLALTKIRLIGLLVPVLPGGDRRFPQPSQLTSIDHMFNSSSTFHQHTYTGHPEVGMRFLSESNQNYLNLPLCKSRHFSELFRQCQTLSSAVCYHGLSSVPTVFCPPSNSFEDLFMLVQQSVEHNNDASHEASWTCDSAVNYSSRRCEFLPNQQNKSFFKSHTFLLEAIRAVSHPLV